MISSFYKNSQTRKLLIRSQWISNKKNIHSTHISRAFNLQLEQDIRTKLDSLPKNSSDIYHNSDGSQRKPSDEELQTIAQLNTMRETRSLSLKDFISLKQEFEDLYKLNDIDLKAITSSSGHNKIIDKIPYHDSKTGEIHWKILRENEKEGWENASYYAYVPALIILVGVLLFKNGDSIDKWAEDELMLRMKERAELENDTELLQALDKLLPEAEINLSRQELNDRDSIIIERILKGDYDNLMGLKIKQQNVDALKEDSTDSAVAASS